MGKSDGVMDGRYSSDRVRSPALVYRYRTRAQVAVDALHEVSHAKQPAVLDLGAADGRTLLHMRSLLGDEGHYHGIELSQELLDSAPAMPANVELLRGDICKLPSSIAADHYDLCAALAVLEHLQDPGAAVREAFRILRPGGVFVATCPNPHWDQVAGRLGLIDEDAHEQELQRPELLSMLAEAGFTDVRFEPFMWAPIGALPYFRVPVGVRFGLKMDSRIRSLRFLNFGFVNQAIYGVK